jgi:two-component system, OmpR family, alkaline phosphatase synthesis response regulator PhoP
VTARILLIVAEKELAHRLSRSLSGEGVEVESADAARALSGEFDLIVMDAFDVCDGLRRKGIDTSILMLSEARVAALRLGADDCVARSCDHNELQARVEALLRRVPRAKRTALKILHFGDVEIDFAIAEARKRGLPVSMTSKELRLLQYLVAHRERIVSRKEILRHVWEYDSAVTSRTVDVHIGWLRQKLEDNPQQPRHIKTIRGRGYRFDSDDQPARRFQSSPLTSVSTRDRSVN